jgi:hypothetical protein
LEEQVFCWRTATRYRRDSGEFIVLIIGTPPNNAISLEQWRPPSMTVTCLKADGFSLFSSVNSVRTRSLLVCRHIAHVKISESVKVDGITYYKMQIFYKRPAKSIQTYQPSEPMADESDYRSPDAVAFQRFSAFADLSHELGNLAEDGHVFQLCSFCESLTSTVRRDRPRIRTKLFGDEVAIHRQLERLINSGLALIQASLHTSSHSCCDGQYDAPILLASFLSGKVHVINKPNDCSEEPKARFS